MIRNTWVRACAVLSALFVATTVHAMSIRDVPLAEITDQTDLWVRGNVVSVKSSPLTEDERYRFGHQGTIEAKVVIAVTKSSRPILTPTVTIHWASGDDFMHWVVKDRECIAALSRQEDGTYRSLWALCVYGWYQIDPESGTVPYVSSIGEHVSPETLWNLVCALEMGQNSPQGPNAFLTDAWRRRLNEGRLHDFIAAMLFFDAFPSVELSPADLLTAFERQFSAYEARLNYALQSHAEKQAMQRAVPVLFSLFQRVGDESSLERIIAVCIRNFSAKESAFDDPMSAKGLVQVILAKGGEQRVGLVRDLLGKAYEWGREDGRVRGSRTPIRADYNVIEAIAEYPGEDTDGMLLDMLSHPVMYGITNSLPLAGVWTALAKRGNPEIETYLKEFLANPQTFNLGVRHHDSVDNSIIYAREALQAYARSLPHDQQMQELLQLYQQGDAGALNILFISITPKDTALIPVLASVPAQRLLEEQYGLANSFSIMAATKLPDPAFLPQLRTLAERAGHGGRVQTHPVLAALYACGDSEPARAKAVERLHEPVPRKDWRTIYDMITEKTGLVSFLGTLDDPALVNEIDPFIRADVLKDYRRKLISAAAAEGKERYDFPVRELHKSAVLALARAGGDDAIARLRTIYEKDDIAARIAAAMGLYALGDETGKELVDLFINHQEFTNTKIVARWRIDLFGDFHHAARYLEDPRTDEALLQRLSRGFSDSDGELTAYPEFVKAHAETLLPIFLENLSNKDVMSRHAAIQLLQRYVDAETDYSPDSPPRRQTAAINHIRDQVDAYLARREQ